MNKNLSKTAELYRDKTLQYLPKSARKEFIDSDLENIAGRFNISIEVELETSTDTYRNSDDDSFYDDNWDYAIDSLKPDYCQAESSVLEDSVWIDGNLDSHITKCYNELMAVEDKEFLIEKINDFRFKFCMEEILSCHFLSNLSDDIQGSSYEEFLDFCRDLESFSVKINISIYEFAQLTRCIEEKIRNLTEDYISEFKPDQDDVRSWINDNCEREDNEVDLEDAARNDLPKLFKKFGKIIEVCEDGSLSNGYEIIVNYNTKYLKGIEQAVDFINTLYEDLEDSSARMDNDSTGLHINISYASDEILSKSEGKRDFCDSTGEIYDPLKALLFLNEEQYGPICKHIPDTRYHSRWCGPIKNKLTTSIKEQLNRPDFLVAALKDIDLKTQSIPVEKMIRQIIKDYSYDYKSTGFNYRYLSQRGYIEFRYPGHEMEKESVIELLIHFCHITRLVFDKEYLKKEANLKKHKFITDIFSFPKKKEFSERKVLYGKFVEFKKKEIVLFPRNWDTSEISLGGYTEKIKELKNSLQKFAEFYSFNIPRLKYHCTDENPIDIRNYSQFRNAKEKAERLVKLFSDLLLKYDIYVGYGEFYYKVKIGFYSNLLVYKVNYPNWLSTFTDFSKEMDKNSLNINFGYCHELPKETFDFMNFLFLNKDTKAEVSSGYYLENSVKIPDVFPDSQEEEKKEIAIQQVIDYTSNHIFVTGQSDLMISPF